MIETCRGYTQYNKYQHVSVSVLLTVLTMMYFALLFHKPYGFEIIEQMVF
jgi:hypothetical protein